MYFDVHVADTMCRRVGWEEGGWVGTSSMTVRGLLVGTAFALGGAAEG